MVDGKPVIGAPHPKQLAVLHEIFKPPYTRKVRRVNLCCGWGFGKTQVAIDAAQLLLGLGPEMHGLFTEPDVSLMNLFLSTWRDIVPPQLYRISSRDRIITWLPTGATLRYDHRNFKGSLEQTIMHFQGWNYAFHIDDETSTACSNKLLMAIEARVRLPRAPILVRLTTTTPRVGEYADLLAMPDSVTIHGKTEDNPHLSRENIAQKRASMSRAQARRDLDGELVALEDQLWQTVDLTQSYPLGNVDDYHPRFNAAYPWYLMCDMGSATGAYVVVQRIDGGYRNGEPRWVIVADFCPQSSADVRRVFIRLKDEFGTPAGISAGQDANTRANTDGATPAYFASKVWGNVPLYISKENNYDKHITYDLTTRLFCASDGGRRLTVARDLLDRKSCLDPDSKRGIVEMIQQDIWLPEEDRRAGEYLPKGSKIRVSHVRDALLMGASTIMRPPEWAKDVEDRGHGLY